MSYPFPSNPIANESQWSSAVFENSHLQLALRDTTFINQTFNFSCIAAHWGGLVPFLFFLVRRQGQKISREKIVTTKALLRNEPFIIFSTYSYGNIFFVKDGKKLIKKIDFLPTSVRMKFPRPRLRQRPRWKSAAIGGRCIHMHSHISIYQAMKEYSIRFFSDSFLCELSFLLQRVSFGSFLQ